MKLTLGRPSPLAAVALVLVGGGVSAAWLDAREEAPADGECLAGACAVVVPGDPTVEPPPQLAASDFCINVGYLCAGLEQQNEIQLRRWKDFEGTIVVHVPLPDLQNTSDARAYQRAAVAGLRAWNNQPFPILADVRGDRNPHFAVKWNGGLAGSQIGLARTRWSLARGLSVDWIELRTPYPGRTNQATAANQVRLTAAHEMGHALGLKHSDSERDVMYPTNSATSMSSQDYRSIEVLYATPDGSVIRR